MRFIHLFALPLILATAQISAADESPQLGQAAVEAKSVEIKRGHVASYPRVFTGKITDASGNPVSRALIEWGPDYPHDAPREVTHSADDGSYHLEVKRAGGKYKLGVSASGCAHQWRQGLVPGPRSAPTELDFKLSPEMTLEVQVVDKSGMPIPDFEVTPMTPQTGFNSSFSIVQQPEPIPGHDKPTPCDASGVCLVRQLLPAPEPVLVKVDGETQAQAESKKRFNDEQGWLSLRITQKGKWGHAHQISNKDFFEAQGKIRIVVPDHRNPLVEQMHNGILFGQVVDATGQPVQEYRVTLRYRPEPLVVKDSEGRFEWGKTLDPDNAYEIRIFANGFAPKVVRCTPGRTSKARPERIEMMPHVSVEFELLDGQTLKPLPNVSVLTGVLKQSGGNYVEWNSIQSYADGHHGLTNVLHLTSGADGRITVPEGQDLAALIILTPGYARTILMPKSRPAPNENDLIQIPIPPAASIRGIAAPGSRISRQATGVSLYCAATGNVEQMFDGIRLYKNGECWIDSLAAGDYGLSLMHSDGNMSTSCWTKKISLKAGERLKIPLGEMTGTLTLSGRTSPFTHVRITRKPLPVAGPLKENLDITSVATFSDVDGYFELNQVESGAYEIELGLDRFSRRFAPDLVKAPRNVVLTEDTHIDYVAGTITPPQAGLDAPATK